MKNTSKVFMILGSLFLLALFFYPLWNITLDAPQYPIPLGMEIFMDRFEDTHEHDLKNINLMNHYVGMQYIPDTIPEFKIFPYVIGIMVFLGVLIGFKGNFKLYLAWFVVMGVFGLIGMYDFYLWEHNYGHNLDENAIMKFTNPDGSVMGFQPPLWGSKDILNFRAHSYPRIGAWFMFVGMGLTLIAGYIGWKASKK